ncbi:hypothetical protein G9A89_022144 [Geosiphon pyriformis]|nr:hypothetical protein G9A89_022144 [Geosiphon pyriformis]
METTIDPSKDVTKQKNEDNNVPIGVKLDDLYKLIDGINVCMLTTRRSDGSLVSRAMQTRTRSPASDIWFIANNQSHKFEEILTDPNVNVAYLRQSTGEWVSVSGMARVDNDREMIKKLYAADIKAWIGDLGDGIHDGSASDPRISLIFVEAQSVSYSKKDRPTIVQWFNIVKGMVTGEPPKVTADRQLDQDELKSSRFERGTKI